MNWEEEGYLLSKKKFRENAIIISVFTQKYGKITGIVYGGTSRKIKNYLQIGNKIFLIHNSKNRNKIGYLKYVITPKGISKRTKLTVDFMKKKMKEYDELREELKQINGDRNVDDN